MKSVLKLILIAAVTLANALWVTSKAQQGYTYTQYTTDLTPYNTSYSLVKGASFVNLLAKKQWWGIDGAPTTYLMTGSVNLESIGGTAGLVISHDQLGVEKLSEAQVFFAKGVRLSDNNYLGASLNGGIRFYNAAYSRLDPFDPKFMDDIREVDPTLGLGLMFYNPEWYYVGISIPKLTIRSLGRGSAEADRHLRYRYYFSGGFVVPFGDDFKLKPATVVSYSANLPMQVDVSTMFYVMDQFGVGVNYRNTQEVAGILSFLFASGLTVGYSYQTTVGSAQIGRLAKPTHELMLGVRFTNWP